LQIDLSPSSQLTGVRAAKKGAGFIRDAIDARGEANVILATGASQFHMLESLVAEDGIDWSVVTIFHLDEYVGVEQNHPASFVRYLKERFLQRVPAICDFISIDGNTGDTLAEISRICEAIGRVRIDVAFVGIGENGHLAFNDPPADFETEEPYICVELDEKCRQQQANEGWFSTPQDVPKQAISMSIRQIMKSASIICTVPDARKAEAVHNVLEGKISNLHPASILRSHPNTHMFLDKDAASRLTGENLS
jgi:glucosamine-6-phosphate deaminase